jgi:hypothetical protein
VQGYEDLLQRTDIPAKRVASLIRFREKRKGRNFDKKIRYAVRKEVAHRFVPSLPDLSIVNGTTEYHQ